MDIKIILEKIFKYLEKNGFNQIDPAGVLFERMAYGKFNPSAGHHVVDPVIQDKNPHNIQNFSLNERCIREADSSRAGMSDRHLSFFEMLAFHSYGEYNNLPQKEVTEIYYNLLINILGLDKNKLLVTILKECKIEDQDFNELETQEIYNAWIELLGKQGVRRTKGRRNFFIAKIPGAGGGAGFEVYYKMINGRYIEIGSQVSYHFIYRGSNNLHKTINGTIGSGVGLERVLMAKEDKETIYDISLIKPLKEIVHRELKDGTEEIFDGNINIISDCIRTITFIIYDKEKSNRDLTESQEKILRKFKKAFSSEIDYLGINYDIYKKLIDKNIEIYKERYTELPKFKDKILSFFIK